MTRRSLIALLLVPVVLVAGIWLGGHPDSLPGFVRESSLVDRSPQARVLDEALDIIEADYYREVDREELLDESLEAGVASLQDRFSAYFDPDSFQHFRDVTSGGFEGVGMTVEGVPKGLRIANIFKGSPADRAGLEPGDVILSADRQPLAGKTTTQATALIKGPRGTSVTLRVVSDGRERQVRVERDRVDVPVVQARMRRTGDERIGHVALASFTAGAHGEVRRAVRELLDDGAEGIVLDLRDNGGGLLNEAVLVSSIFIPEGTIVSTKGRSRPRRVFEASGPSIDRDVPVSVLVNRNSASASEIVAGAIQDRERGTVVGTRTFGKGVFQEVQQLSNGGALDITVGEYYTPSGKNLGGGGTRRGAGIEPDVAARDDTDTERRDEALQAALRTVARAGD
ncbi:MAG: S41 family peptidase [Solirubrobacterales bacterium]|nr:S41 family peptidase [Solirubrobacterales bacterium]